MSAAAKNPALDMGHFEYRRLNGQVFGIWDNLKGGYVIEDDQIMRRPNMGRAMGACMKLAREYREEQARLAKSDSETA
ncbi:hypothetical protein [Erythrobacter aureus]|uniref:Uncharacterized protein n=1 Tax=Erythrobacter aureus TaxID=2182384 RepID=A0A345YJF7_9SPHN|nr:hypothetical protein [Erythrobacter aureus]AXK44059.1 hypothetical protein DVR09_16530 [Erythrobacter aureus]